MLAAAFGCRGILVDHPLKFMGGNILLLAAIGTNIPMVILVGHPIGAAAVRLRPLRVETGVIRNTECPAARRIADTCAVSPGIPAGKGVAAEIVPFVMVGAMFMACVFPFAVTFESSIVIALHA